MDTRLIVTTILDELNIVYWNDGKNVSLDSINIQCPFHDCADQSNHMGIFDDSMLYSCWVCKRKGHFSYLLSIITGDSVEDCQSLIDEHSDSKDKEGTERIYDASNAWQKKQEDREEILTVPLPEQFKKIHEGVNYPLLRKYLKRRNLSVEQVIGYGCGFCRTGRYMNRLVIPIHQNNIQVSFCAADMTGKAEVPYDYPSMAINNYLYGLDDVDSVMAVTEGIYDSWPLGAVGTAMFGSYLTNIQKSLIIKKNLDILLFCLDGDAYWHARKEAVFFEPYIETVKVIFIPWGEDPDSLGMDTIWKMIHTQMFGGTV